jgi:broad specificity phosphatase PhoE
MSMIDLSLSIRPNRQGHAKLLACRALMSTLYLVRHAKPAATWGEATDPGLDATGVSQAESTAADLQRRLPQLAIYSSPLRRCVETAQPLAHLWKTPAKLLPEVAEVPSPPLSMADRAKWLATGMQGTWEQLQASSPPGSPNYSDWRATLLRTLRRLPSDAVIYSHYIAINVVIGAAQGHDRVISFRPGHASVSVIEVANERFVVRELGVEADGGVLLGK